MIGYHKRDGINRLEDDFLNPDENGTMMATKHVKSHSQSLGKIKWTKWKALA
jgi:hypothetical protein